MQRYGFPSGRMVLGMVLGFMAESEFRRSLIMSYGSSMIFLTRPDRRRCSLGLTVAVLVYPPARLWGVRRRPARAGARPRRPRDATTNREEILT